MTAVSLVPSQDRPYVHGSPNDSVYTQVFDYNGLARLTGNWASVPGPPGPILATLRQNGQSLNAETFGIKASWHRVLAGPFAADSGRQRLAAVGGRRRVPVQAGACPVVAHGGPRVGVGGGFLHVAQRFSCVEGHLPGQRGGRSAVIAQAAACM